MLSASCALRAQLADSLFVGINTFHQSLISSFWESPILFTHQKIGSYTQTELDFQYDRLDFKRVQTPKSSYQYRFRANGIFNYSERLRLFGDFSAARLDEKRLGYNFSSERTTDQNVLTPNYFFAPKPGDWSNQKYKLAGGASYQFKNQFLLAAQLRYNTQSSYRILDPRPQLQSSLLGATMQVGYAWNRHRFFVDGSLDRISELEGIMYVDAYQNAPVYTETYTQFSSGYGRVIINSSLGQYLNHTLQNGWGGGYQWRGDKKSLVVQYHASSGERKFFRRDEGGDAYVSEKFHQYTYNFDQQHLQIQYYMDGGSTDFNAAINYTTQAGDNFSVETNGSNYVMDQSAVSIEAGIIKYEGELIRISAEGFVKYADHQYLDYLGYTDKSLQTIEVGVISGSDVLVGANARLNVSMGLNYYSSLNDQLIFTAVSSQTLFADNVVFPDHAFDVTSWLQPSWRAFYERRLSGNKKAGVYCEYSFTKPLGEAYQDYYPDLRTGTNQWFTSGIIVTY